MNISKHAWNQLKNKTAKEIIAALKRDGWMPEESRGATRGFRSTDGRRVVIHYHPGKTYRPKLLKGLLTDIGWSEQRMKDLKLIK